ncbi:hypothetical protein ACFCV3_41910 [Kribbella sp. NPDC056345]|uniref:hypothetical protein n=1 Tax=Kribbella sp. NPDC056345 TaxID=3345789 RepID=UPI0035DD0B61
MNALAKFLSKENEPVRRYLYSIATAVLVLLGTLGLVTGSVATAIGGVLVAALLIQVTPVLRSKVSPVPVPVPGDEDEVPVPVLPEGD